MTLGLMLITRAINMSPVPLGEDLSEFFFGVFPFVPGSPESNINLVWVLCLDFVMTPPANYNDIED
jgi:hypothetical protein